MKIREIVVEDVDIYRAHRIEMLNDSPDAFLTTPDEYALRPREFELRRLRDNNLSDNVLFIGAFEGDTLLGSMGIVRQIRPKKRHIATIVAVYVTPSAREKGIGGKLLDKLIKHARKEMPGIELLQLGVSSDNEAALALYGSRGFVRYGTEPRAMRDGDRYINEDHMWLDIAEPDQADEAEQATA